MNKLSNYSKIFFVLFSLIFIHLSYADEQMSTNKLTRCVTCHTISGNSTTTIWPKLAEQHASYMLKQLLEFKKGKDGTRYDPTMVGMLQGVTESDMLELSDHFSKQVLEKKKIKVNNTDFEAGKNIYLFGDKENNVVACVGCHGITGTGNKLANFPHLKWQHKDYIIIQLKKFKKNERSNDVNGIMRDISSNMSEQQMNFVASYISAMK
ncbi:MAG TPA: c-type cytochrome [Candidatus Azoamicus sp. MARI]